MTRSQPTLDGIDRAAAHVVGIDTLDDPEFLEVRSVLERDPDTAALGWSHVNRLTLAIQEALAQLRASRNVRAE